MGEDVKDLILATVEASLDAQLRAVRKLRRSAPSSPRRKVREGRSQVDMAYDVLRKAGAPLHISEILAQIRASFGVTVDRESLVSSLSKKVIRGDRFVRTGKSLFALRPEVSP